MTHCSDDELILLYYGESDEHTTHVGQCADCTARYRDLQSMLQMVAVGAVPERDDRYGLEVWQRIRHQLPQREPWWRMAWSWQGMAAAAALVLVAAGFTAGRLWPSAPAPPTVAAGVPAGPETAATRRVLLLTVADHLERSDRILTDIVNTRGGGDIAAEQAWAADLVAANRLYRQEATETNETSLAAVLDELERTLLEIVHRPSHVTPTDLDDIRRRIDSAALLFKVRVVSTELRELTEPAPAASSLTTIG